MIAFLASSGEQSSAFPATAFVAGLALVFTVGSFYWLNARQGRLRSYEPHSFAARAGQDDLRLLLPLVLYNTGAKPIVVQNLWLRFPDESAALLPLPWTALRARINPGKDDGFALPAAFAVEGRSAERVFVEFGGPFPGFNPDWDCTVSIEVKLGHRKGATPLLSFTLRASRITQPGYIAYSNAPTEITDGDLRKANAALKDLLDKNGNRNVADADQE
ncbi:hypothetical protein [Streptomyces chartreusis]|uniref:hypothetical protein n=1 Tax=Streptomyces chartreusis TaxID=1969 RepID=UPI00364ECF5B